MKNKILQRPRVTLALDSILEYPLTIVSATVGYGKTTAIKEWLKTTDVHIVFYPLYEDDRLESLSWHRFTTAWEKTFAEQHNLKGLNGFPHDIQQVNEFVDILSKAATDKPILVICDDYHHIDHNPHIRKLVEHITQEEIPNFHMVLLSRHLTQLNSALLSSKGLCYIINTDTLAFTPEETIEYLALNGLPNIGSELLDRINKFAEGWPAALCLTQISVRRNANIPILDMDYLMHECFNNIFDPYSRDLLAKLSFLEKFSIPQALYILETSDIVQLLDVAMEQNAFIYFDHKTGNYRLHALARIFLHKVVQNKAITLSRVKYLNGVWLMDNGYAYESIKYYLEAGHSLELMQILDAQELGYLSSLNAEPFYQLCRSLPLDTCIQYPLTYLHIILNFILSENQNMALFAKKILEIMEQHFCDIDPDSSFILAEIEIVKTAIHFNDVYKIVEHSTKALLLFKGRDSKIACKTDPTSFGIPMYTYMFFKQSGDLEHLVNFHRTELVPMLSTYNIMHGVDHLLLAEYNLEIGELEKAKLHAQLAAYIALSKKSLSVFFFATFALVRYDLAVNNVGKAAERISDARQLLHDNRGSMTSETHAIYNTSIVVCEAYMNALLGNLEYIPDWIKSGDLIGGEFRAGGMGFLNIIRSQILMQEGRWLELEALAPSFGQAYQMYNNRLGTLHNELYLAIAKYNLYGAEIGTSEMLKFLEQTKKDNLVLMIAENAKHVLPIFKQMQGSKHIPTDYFDKLVSATKQYEKILNAITPDICPSIHIVFTEREREVLNLLKQGLMGKEIAAKLCLSLIAVKKHLGNVYKKLEVTHKGAAIKKLHDLKLI